MSFRYIGSKARLVDQLGEFIGKPYSKESYFIDAFAVQALLLRPQPNWVGISESMIFFILPS
jgi:hypothetical protein